MEQRTPARNGRPTIIDVAREAGVSKSQVSAALRGNGRVSEATRERIAAAAERLGYRHNALARSLVRGRTGLLAVIVTDLGSPYHAGVARGLDAASDALGTEAIILNGRRDTDHLVELLDVALQLQVDGLVVSSSWLPVAALQDAARVKPVAVIGRMTLPDGPLGFDTVRNDDALGASHALQHLADLGHRRIAVLTASERPAHAARLEAYRAWMRASGVPVEEYGAAAGPGRDVAALVERLHAPDAPTAVFATNDAVATDLLRAASDAGLEAPGDLSVVGYDDTELAARWRPGLTSLSQPLGAMAAAAVDHVATRMAGREEDVHDVLPGALVARGTTAAPR